MTNSERKGTGLFFGIAAYTIWGLLPLFWHYLHKASAFEILAHRGVWSLLLCVILLAFLKKLKGTIAIFRQPRTLALLALTSFLLTINWGVYIWSVSVNRIVEASLGYYITPLVSVTFGVLVLRERLRRMQWIAVSIAAIGVFTLTFEYGAFPWIAFVLAVTWSSYSLLKKALQLGALEGISIETLFALLPNLVYLTLIESQHRAQFGLSLGFSVLLAFAGVATVIPLLLFNGATTRLPLTMTGLLQYITPTIMFMVGTLINHEPMPAGRAIGFGLIWIALIFLGADLVKSNRTTASAL
ncbi:MAG: EamA family transporter RarD [Actinobacteria bacterium]|nr:EamA family transporter RarD [Actinomycetota bacterium]TRZ85158.1 MAG: EamA family transporter RarD [Streptomycetaceae bacterium]MSY10290.1 EamA family transporter RarD [Actinomycetota bacterium]MSY54775.1 EamA family transporter RarD [Actinomycetota bacterium]MSZ69445.1 EamA family transporter RarD [Actinomycetota bacterium]